MDRRVKILGVVVVVAFGVLFIQLNNLQVRDAHSLDAKSAIYTHNPGPSPWDSPRGAIVSSDGVELAYTKQTAAGYERVYPEGSLFADVTGYYDETQFAAPLGLEGYYNSDLLVHNETAKNLKGVLTDRTGTDTIETTVSLKLQRVAAAALGSLTGAVVAVNVRTGAILAMYSNPSYDPNKLSSLDASAVAKYFSSLQALGGASPLVNGVTRSRLAPGSTFKIITTSAMIDNHETKLLDKTWPKISSTAIKGTDLRLQNFAGELCGGPLPLILADSCDTAYALIGQALGPAKLGGEARKFGFDHVPPIDLPAGETIPAYFPPQSSFVGNEPFVAYSAIGQGNVQETVLEDALVAAAIGDGGVIMTPHLLANVINDSGQVVETYHPHAWRRATSAATASEVRSLMLGVTRFGTAAGVFPSDLNAAAKTGTAETELTGCSAEWLTATAPAGTGQTPEIAAAALVPAQSGVSCSETGAEIAGPIVAKVIEAYLGSSR